LPVYNFRENVCIMLIDLKGLTRAYDGNPRPVLDNISLTITNGSAVAIIGPSGSGKSTLLNLIGTLDFPDSGEVLLNGTPTSVLKPDELVAIRNKQIGFVFQNHLLLPQLNVIENVLLPLMPRDKGMREQSPERAKKLLHMVGLEEKVYRFPGEMSVGECQRVAVVRALINQPELLLTDEPTGSLDHDSAENLSNLLLELHGQFGFTLITVTHSMELAGRMQVIYKLVNGKLSVN